MTVPSRSTRQSVWGRARALAARTPPGRNRYVDFLRAASIVVVVIGHWLMAAPSLEGGRFSLGDMLRLAPWSQWLTWAFQVMPLFFIVGGYANAASWEAACRSGGSYGAWINGRLRRLVVPVVPLLVAWSLLALIGRLLGLSATLVGIGSQVAFIPTWFLAVYVLVVVVAPWMHRLWRRFGMASFLALAAGAVLIDALAFGAGAGWLRWANYAFVWLGVHHLGFLWWDGRLSGRTRALGCAGIGLATLVVLVFVASYPVSMITVPGEELSNSRPPTLALLALGMLHGGLVLAVETPARRWLERLRPWTATILVNGSIMTLYLWHATVMVLVVGLLYWLGGVGLRQEPASAQWWATRPVWIVTLFAVLGVFVTVLGRFEQLGRSVTTTVRPAWSSVAGAALVCGGMATLALGGIAGADGGLRTWVLLLTFAGVVLATGRVPGARVV
jgi:hypothetical protein